MSCLRRAARIAWTGRFRSGIRLSKSSVEDWERKDGRHCMIAWPNSSKLPEKFVGVHSTRVPRARDLIGGEAGVIRPPFKTKPETQSTKRSHIFPTPFLKRFGGAFRYLFHRMGQQTTSARPPILHYFDERVGDRFRYTAFLHSFPRFFFRHIDIFEGPADDSGQNFNLFCHRKKLRTGKLVGLVLVAQLD